MTTQTTTDIETTIDVYLAAWLEPDADRRAQLIGQAWATDGELADPLQVARGHGGINEMIATIQAQFPGHDLRRTSGIDTHHEHFRFAWELLGPDGTVVTTGLDVGAVDGDGRLRSVTGFFGEVPPQ